MSIVFIVPHPSGTWPTWVMLCPFVQTRKRPTSILLFQRRWAKYELGVGSHRNKIGFWAFFWKSISATSFVFPDPYCMDFPSTNSFILWLAVRNLYLIFRKPSCSSFVQPPNHLISSSGMSGEFSKFSVCIGWYGMWYFFWTISFPCCCWRK